MKPLIFVSLLALAACHDGYCSPEEAAHASKFFSDCIQIPDSTGKACGREAYKYCKQTAHRTLSLD